MRPDRRAATTITALVAATTLAFGPAAAASAEEITAPDAPQSPAPEGTAAPFAWDDQVTAPAMQAGVPVDWTIPATGADGFTADLLPAGLTIDGGRLTGTPTEPGSFTVTFTALATGQPDSSRVFVLVVAAAPPVWEGADAVTVSAFDPVDVWFSAAGADSYSAETLPGSLVFGSDGHLTGSAPDAVTQVDLVLTAAGAGGSVTRSFVVLFDWAARVSAPTVVAGVPAAGQQLVLAADGLVPGGEVLLQVTDQDGVVALEHRAWADESGRLNTALPLPSSAAGAYQATFTAPALAGGTAGWTVHYSVDTAGTVVEVSTAGPVDDPLPAPSWAADAGIAPVRAGEQFTATIAAADATTHHVDSVLPDGVEFDPAAATLTGKIPSPGSYDLTVTAANRRGATSHTFTVTVNPAGLLTITPLFQIGDPADGALVELTGQRLDPGTSFTVTVDGESVLEQTVGPDGATTGTAAIPATAGAHRIEAGGEAVGRTITEQLWVTVDENGRIASITADEPDAGPPTVPGQPAPVPVPLPEILEEWDDWETGAAEVEPVVAPVAAPAAVSPAPGFNIDGGWLFGAGVVFAGVAAMFRRRGASD
ncbi:putative Ig domain-containing protein [Agromyces humi]|uniref:putative Ig domain-containing protein n=1 Tax=Agromyces humi TaxID=1766800 RepID=UPI00135BA7F4|nr:putative Ig domain-containing protein [Agromyces humi]